MLRVGLTGGLGAGKSTVLTMFAARGAVVLQADAIGRDLMQPGQRVYAAIVKQFGAEVVLPGGALDRPALARLAFDQGRLEELNGIVHPAVITQQEEWMRGVPKDAVVVIESALIFETTHGGPEGWRERFDRLILVTAPDVVKIARFLERSDATAETAAALEAEARRRMAAQMPDDVKIPQCDFVVRNDGDLLALEVQVQQVWRKLVEIVLPDGRPTRAAITS